MSAARRWTRKSSASSGVDSVASRSPFLTSGRTPKSGDRGATGKERLGAQTKSLEKVAALGMLLSPAPLVSFNELPPVASTRACRSFVQARFMWTIKASSCRSFPDRLYKSTASRASAFEAGSMCHHVGRGAICRRYIGASGQRVRHGRLAMSEVPVPTGTGTHRNHRAGVRSRAPNPPCPSRHGSGLGPGRV